MNDDIYTPQVIEGDRNINKAKCEMIKACIDSYLQKHPNLSLQNLENKSGLPISTLRRISNLNGNPNPESVIKLCRSLGFDQELEKYLEKYHPDIAAIMASRSHNQDRNYVVESEAYYFTDKSSFLIMTMAHTSFGITEEEIRQQLGLQGISQLNELMKKGFIIKTDNGRLIGKSEKYKLSFKDTLKRIEISLGHYRLEEAGNVNNFINYQTESLNLKGLEALKALELKQAVERREQVFNNPALYGNFKVFIATVSSTFVAYNNSADSVPEVLQ